MAVLGYVKWTVQVYDHPLTREILLLIQREADLMYRGRSARSISGLRRRIEHLFLQVITSNIQNIKWMLLLCSIRRTSQYYNIKLRVF